MAPYWLPWLGHSLSLLTNADRFIGGISQKSKSRDMFSLNVLGSRWNIIASRSLCGIILQQPPDIVDFEPVLWSHLRSAFDADQKQRLRYSAIFEEFRESPDGAQVHRTFRDATIQIVQSQVPDIVSFSSGIIDQHLWERPSHTHVIDNENVDINFFSLIQSFVGYTTLTTLLGSDFMTVYPGVVEDLKYLDYAMRYMILGIPRCFPIPTLAKAYAARRRLDNAIDSFHRALDEVAAGEEPDELWRDLSDVSDIIKERSALYRKHSAPPVLKGPLELCLIWSVTSKIPPLVAWCLLRILANPKIVSKIQSEIGPFAKVLQPPEFFGITQIPRLELNMSRIESSCLLLKACFQESIRLDTSPVILRKIRTDLTISQPSTPESFDQPSRAYALRAGDFLAIPLALYYRDPSIFESPLEFQPARHNDADEKGERRRLEESDGTMPWACSDMLGLEAATLQSIVLASVAGILATWDFEPAESDNWHIPMHRTSPNFTEPEQDIRVRVRRKMQG